MKTKFYYITAILSMLIMALTVKAQEAEYEYVPIVREGVEWGYKTLAPFFNPKSDYYRIQLKGDTVINDRTYKRCYAYQTATLDTATASLHGFLREEDKRVYFIPNPKEEDFIGTWWSMKMFYQEMYNDEERMIYDFNLNKGDTFCPVGLPVNIVDVYMVEVDGKLRKYFKAEYDSYSFLEGVGVIGYGDLTYPFTDQPTDASDLQFNFERNVADGRIVYKSEEFDDRDPTCAGESIAATLQSSGITITVAGKAVTVAADGTITATIHDINGRTVVTAQSADGSASIDMTSFTHGIYIVTATTANDHKTRKIIL